MLLLRHIGSFFVLLLFWVNACSGRAPEAREMSVPTLQGQQQSEIVLTWRRDGGIAGLCDQMQVSASGDVQIQSCRPKAEKAGKLSSDDLARLNGWRKSLGSVVIEFKDGGLIDAMTSKVTLKGTGSGQPADAQRQEILEWAQRLYSRIKS